MTNSEKLYYKICRENEGMTQAESAAIIGIDEATLSRYENGHASVPQDVVASMIKAYRTPRLAWWHVIHDNPALMPYIPEPPRMVTSGDMMMRIEFAEDEIAEVRYALKKMLKEGCLCCEASEATKSKAASFRALASKFMGIAGYLDEQAALDGRCGG